MGKFLRPVWTTASVIRAALPRSLATVIEPATPAFAEIIDQLAPSVVLATTANSAARLQRAIRKVDVLNSLGRFVCLIQVNIILFISAISVWYS